MQLVFDVVDADGTYVEAGNLVGRIKYNPKDSMYRAFTNDDEPIGEQHKTKAKAFEQLQALCKTGHVVI